MIIHASLNSLLCTFSLSVLLFSSFILSSIAIPIKLVLVHLIASSFFSLQLFPFHVSSLSTHQCPSISDYLLSSIMPVMGWGLHEWLQEPSPGKRFALTLSMKKTILILMCFLLLIGLGVAEYFFIDKFHLILPRLVHAILFLIELITFLVFVFAIYPERAPFVIPFGITQLIRIILLSVLIVYYIVISIVTDKGSPFMATGHLFFVLIAHLLLGYLTWQSYLIFRNRGCVPYSSASPPTLSTGHHVIVLQQPIEEAMYGKKPVQPS